MIPVQKIINRLMILIFKYKKAIVVALSCAIISTIYSSMITMAYAVEYKHQEIGTIYHEPDREIEKIDSAINNKMIDKKVNIKENTQLKEKFIFAAAAQKNKISIEKVISADNELNNGYVLEIHGKALSWANEKESLLHQINDFIDYIHCEYPEYDSVVKNNYTIKPAIYKDQKFAAKEDIISAFRLKLVRTECVSVIRQLDPKIIYVYGLTEQTYRAGNKSTVRLTYLNHFLNDSLVKTELNNTEILTNGGNTVIMTPDVSKIKYDYDATILGLAEAQSKFLNQILPAALEGQKQYHIPVSLTLGQAVLESGWGVNHISNNIYGFKAKSNWQGKTTIKTTKEFENGEYKEIQAVFKAYDNFEKSVKDYLELISSNKRYSDILAATDYISAADAIGKSGYATSPVYGNSVREVIEKYHLYIWDNISE